MIRDFLLEIFAIHEKLDGGGEPVHVTSAPPVGNWISCGAVLSSYLHILLLLHHAVYTYCTCVVYSIANEREDLFTMMI